jgi:hypothetical protein
MSESRQATGGGRAADRSPIADHALERISIE